MALIIKQKQRESGVGGAGREGERERDIQEVPGVWAAGRRELFAEPAGLPRRTFKNS